MKNKNKNKNKRILGFTSAEIIGGIFIIVYFIIFFKMLF